MIAGTTFNFSWRPPSIAAHLTTGYNLNCLPLLAGIPAPETLELLPTATAAAVTDLFHGVTYNCSITTVSGVGASEPQTVILTTAESSKCFHPSCIVFFLFHIFAHLLSLAPSAAPLMFAADVGERQVVFSWSPPPVTQRNGVITSYTLSCSPSPSSLPQSPSLSGSLTVTGFSPDTAYSCSVVATNSRGSGPPANITFTMQQDCKSNYTMLFFLCCSSEIILCRYILSTQIEWTAQYMFRVSG